MKVLEKINTHILWW